MPVTEQEVQAVLRRASGFLAGTPRIYQVNTTTGRLEWVTLAKLVNLLLSGYLAVGYSAAPLHTTAGYATVKQLLTGVDYDFSALVPNQTIAVFHRDSTIAGTLGVDSPLLFVHDEAIDLNNANPKSTGVWLKQMLTPSGNTAVGYMGIEQQLRHDSGAFNMGSIRAWAPAFEKVVGGTVTLVRLAEMQIIPQGGTITTADAAYGSIVPATAATITTAYGFRANLDAPAGGTITTGVAFDATLDDSGGVFTTGIGLRVNAPPTLAPATFIAIQTLAGEHRLVGNVKIGANSAPTAPLDVVGVITGSTTINAGTGFTVSNGAGSGQFLRGNGSAFVSNTIQVADVPSHTHTTHDNRTRTIWIPAKDFTARTGAPTFAIRGANTVYTAMDFDAAAIEDVIAEVEMPSDYVSAGITVKLHWTNLGAGVGNVDWLVQTINRADTGDYNSVAALVGGTTVTVAAPAQNVKKVTTLTITFTPGALTDTFVLIISRRGTNGTDTLANDAGMVGVELSYTGDS